MGMKSRCTRSDTRKITGSESIDRGWNKRQNVEVSFRVRQGTPQKLCAFRPDSKKHRPLPHKWDSRTILRKSEDTEGDQHVTTLGDAKVSLGRHTISARRIADVLRRLRSLTIQRRIHPQKLLGVAGLTLLFQSHANGQLSDEFNIYFGNLHSHTSYSDGVKKPDFAYDFARNQGNLDFIAITEHNHRKADGKGEREDGKLIATDHSLYRDLIRSAREKNDKGDFVTIWGQEFSAISKGNHLNVFGPEIVIDDEKVKSGDYKKLYEEWIPNRNDVQVVQFNHPWDGKNKALQYGLSQYGGSHKKLREASEEAGVRLIEVINGPGTKNQTGIQAKVKGESHYKSLLTRGYRLAPTANQDNHWITWGTLTGARTGVLAKSLNRTSILNALDARRTFASTDANLHVWFSVNDAIMGEEIDADSRDLELKYEIEDTSEPNATYKVQVVSGSFAASDSAKTKQIESDIEEGEHEATFRVSPTKAFVYLRITQSASTPAKRDKLITAPVWVNIQ